MPVSRFGVRLRALRAFELPRPGGDRFYRASLPHVSSPALIDFGLLPSFPLPFPPFLGNSGVSPAKLPGINAATVY